MCGIAGYVGEAAPEELRATVQRIMIGIERRGPDGEGLETWPAQGGPGAALGHRRLAILDLSPLGAQPYLNDDRSVGLVFNGCIYNFQEVRAELEQLGHRFRSQCDTEVLLRGFEQWGIDALMPRLRGMFAFAFWESKIRRLTLVRDRLGVKPLAYQLTPGGIAFASTVSALRTAGFGGDMDPEAILEYLEFGFVVEPHCIYAGMHKLPPATILEWRDGQLSQRVYWTLLEADEDSRTSFDQAVEETESLLIESVRLRLIADVPVGALLSGGIDSTLVCWAMSKLNANIKAFTVSAPGHASDESADAAATARKLGIEHEVIPLPQETSHLLEDLGAAYGEPLGANSALGMLLVSKAVKPSATVMLTGDGGDDIFLGYPFFRNAWRAQQLARRLPPAFASAWPSIAPLVPAVGPLRRMRNLLNYATTGLSGHALAHDGLPYFEANGLLGDRLRDQTISQRRIAPSFDSACNLLGEVTRYHHRMHFLSEFMPKVDNGTMFHALESRAPLLDQKLWEFAARLPARLHFHQGRLKAILREIVRRHLGEEVAYRQKQGFTVPVERWLAERWQPALLQLRQNSRLEAGGWLTKGGLAPCVDAAIARQHIPMQLWFVLVLENWLAQNQPRN